MADEYLQLDILTPAGRVDLRLVEVAPPDKEKDKGAPGPIEVEGVELPAALGEMGVRPGHVPFLTPLVPGVVRFRFEGEDQRLAVGAGFLEISETGGVTILTERAQRSWEIEVEAARGELAEVVEELGKHASASIVDTEVLKLDARRAWLDAQLRAAGAGK